MWGGRFGFITYQKKEDAQRALQELHQKELKDFPDFKVLLQPPLLLVPVSQPRPISRQAQQASHRSSCCHCCLAQQQLLDRLAYWDCLQHC